jgi:hypothetical protein
MIGTEIYSTLVDTGATHSFIDIHLVETLNISYNKARGEIDLASFGHTVARVGITQPITITPFISLRSVRRQPEITHSFELLELPTDRYRFIVGLDLIKILFKRYIPIELLPGPRDDYIGRMEISSLVSVKPSIRPADYDTTTTLTAQPTTEEISPLAGEPHLQNRLRNTKRIDYAS